MVDQLIVVVIVKFLHDLCSTVWIGGMITIGLITMPSAKKILGEGKETKALMDLIKRRMSYVIYLCIVVLLITGLLLGNRSGLYGGPLSTNNEYSLLTTIKHLIYAVMIIIAVFRSRFIDMLKITPQTNKKLSFILLITNIILGLIALILSSYLSVLSAAAAS